MKFLATFLTIFAVLALAMASNVFEKDFSNSGHPGKCVISDDIILDPGLHPHPTDKCISYDCKEDGKATVFFSHPAGCQPKPPTPTPPPVKIE